MFTITIATENAAFEYDKAAAVNELLRKVIRELGAGHTEGAVMDLNGNKVGSYELTETVTCGDCGLEPATAGEHGDLCADCYREQYAGGIYGVGFSSYANDRARRALDS